QGGGHRPDRGLRDAGDQGPRRRRPGHENGARAARGIGRRRREPASGQVDTDDERSSMRYPMIAVALVSSGALAVAGCGGGSKKSASSPASTPAPAPTTTPAAPPAAAGAAGLTIGETG